MKPGGGIATGRRVLGGRPATVAGRIGRPESMRADLVIRPKATDRMATLDVTVSPAKELNSPEFSYEDWGSVWPTGRGGKSQGGG